MADSPTLDVERLLHAQGFRYVAGVDEVGRGALAGPVTVGVAVVDDSVSEVPLGLRDSKQMSATARTKIIPAVEAWVIDYALGSATAQEIDEIGIVLALKLAWTRAYEALKIKPQAVILDGKHNWLVVQSDGLFTIDIPTIDVDVTMQVKADAHCGSVAAASVLAKVSRDRYMQEIATEFPDYGWQSNVGYGAAIHLDAIRSNGPTMFHRRSWSLPEQEQG